MMQPGERKGEGVEVRESDSHYPNLLPHSPKISAKITANPHPMTRIIVGGS